jgi:voltage-gated potassium channel
MPLLALAVVPALLLEDAANPTLQAAGFGLNWAIWIAFVADYGLRLLRAENKRTFVRHEWIDLGIIAITPPFLLPSAWQGLRAARALRLLRLARSASLLLLGLHSSRHVLVRHRIKHLAIVVGVVVGLGAVGIYVAEGDINKNVASFGDALWWAVVTATTVGYGDISPVSTEGRLVAGLLMFSGIGAIGVLTATITSLFFENDQTNALADINQRLVAIEAELKRIGEQ